MIELDSFFHFIKGLGLAATTRLAAKTRCPGLTLWTASCTPGSTRDTVSVVGRYGVGPVGRRGLNRASMTLNRSCGQRPTWSFRKIATGRG